MAPHKSEYVRNEMKAVIYGDNTDVQFDPITRDTPKLLLPLVNTPLIDYTLDWLHRCGVEDVLIYCQATPHGPSIKQHCSSLLERRQWKMSVRVLATNGIQSLGDAMRDLYAKRYIVDDFILVQGGALANVNLKNMIKVHKGNKKLDSKVAMTCMFSPSLLQQQQQQQQQEQEVVEDQEQPISDPAEDSADCIRVSTIANIRGKILTYNRHRTGSNIILPSYLAYENTKLVISGQMGDPSIAICGIDLPGLFADSFDCMTMESMIKSLIMPDDLNECSVFQYIARDGYATTMATWKDYERISLAIIQRQFTPQVAEISLTSARTRYNENAFNSHYWTNSGSIGSSVGFMEASSFRLQQNRMSIKVVCGEGIELSSKSAVRCCVFGNLCSVAENVTLERVFVGDNCTIGAGCEARQCYLGDNVTLLPNTKLLPGCVVASGVTLGPNQTLDAASLVSNKQTWDKLTDFDKNELVTLSPSGVLFPRLARTDDELPGFTLDSNNQTLPIWGIKDDDFVIPDQEEEEDYSSSEEEGDDCVDAGAAIGGEEEEEEMDEDELASLNFQREVMESLVLSIKSNSNPSNVAIEINASRYAYNINVSSMQHIVFKGVLRCYDEYETGEEYTSTSTWPAWPIIKKGLHRYKQVLQKYMKKDADYLNTLESMIMQDERVLPSCINILNEMNQTMELLDDQYMLHWFNQGGSSKNDSSPAFAKLKEKVSPFLSWLEEAEEESSSEEQEAEEEQEEEEEEEIDI